MENCDKQSSKGMFFARRRFKVIQIQDTECQILEPKFKCLSTNVSLTGQLSCQASPIRKQKQKITFATQEKSKPAFHKYPIQIPDFPLVFNNSEFQPNIQLSQNRLTCYPKERQNPFMMYVKKEAEYNLFTNSMISKSLKKKIPPVKKCKIFRKQVLKTDCSQCSTFNDNLKIYEKSDCKVIDKLKKDYKISAVRRKTSMVSTYYQMSKIKYI